MKKRFLCYFVLFSYSACALPGTFQGRGVFLEFWLFDEHSPTAQERKAPQGKNIRFFHLETLKNCILNGKYYPQMTTIRTFFPKLGHLYPIFKKEQGRLPPYPLQLRACSKISTAREEMEKRQIKHSQQQLLKVQIPC